MLGKKQIPCLTPAISINKWQTKVNYAVELNG